MKRLVFTLFWVIVAVTLIVLGMRGISSMGMEGHQ